MSRVVLLVVIAALAGCASDPATARKPDGSLTGDARADSSTPEASKQDGPGTGGDGSVIGDAGITTVDALVVSGEDGGVVQVDPRDPVQNIAFRDPAEVIGKLPQPTLDGEVFLWPTGDGCLGVVDPTAATPIVDVVACQDGSNLRWRNDGGLIEWAADPNLCLDILPTQLFWHLTLSPCGATQYTVTLSSGVLTAPIPNGSLFATLVPAQPGQPSIQAFGGNGAGWPRWQLLSELEAAASTPVTYPVQASNTSSVAAANALGQLSQMLPPYALPSIDPSALRAVVPAGTPQQARRVYMDRRFDHDTGYLRAGATPLHWQATGLYALPGQTLAVIVPDNVAPGLRVRINVHTDLLEPSSPNIMLDGEFRRPPLLTTSQPLQPGVNAVRNVAGGSVVIESKISAEQVDAIDVYGGVEQPRFVLGVTDTNTWLARRQGAAPYAILESETTILVVPSYQIVALDRPVEVAARFDKVSERLLVIAGLEGSAPEHRSYQGKHWLVTDRQISAGYGHAGIPVMVVDAWNLARQENFGDGWGVWHELGHNHQQFNLWSIRFGTEVNVNIFALDLNENYNTDTRIGPAATKMASQLAVGVVPFDSLSDLTDQLVFFAQPAWATARRYEMYADVFRGFRELSVEQVALVQADDALKADYLYRFMSKGAGIDLASYFARWGFAVSQDAKNAVAADGLKLPSTPIWTLTKPN